MEKLIGMKGEIEAQFGQPLKWKRKQIWYSYEDLSDAQELRSDPDQSVPDEDKWHLVLEFVEKYAPVFESVMSDALLKIKHETGKESVG